MKGLAQPGIFDLNCRRMATKDDDSNVEKLMQKFGYLRCQIEVTDIIIEREKLLSAAVKKLEAELIHPDELLKRQEKINALHQLRGEAEALKSICHQVFSLQPPTSSLN